MARRTKAPKPGKWQYRVHDLTAYERADRAYAIYTRVRRDGKYRDRTYLCASIRDAAGAIVPDLEATAIQLAVERQKKAAAGLPDVARGPLTIARGFQLMLHQDGKYPSDSARKREVERFSKTIINVLGGTMLWSDIRYGHYRKLWRTLAREHARDRSRFGPEAAVKIVGALRTATTWLHEKELLDPGMCLPAPTWKQQMRAEWVEITSTPISKPRRHRYTVEEQTKLWGALTKADPRIEVLVQVGAELRLGQVLRSRRSDVAPYGGFRIGRVNVHGRGRKHGDDPILTMAARHALTRAMTRGYLADLEAAYRAGEIADYYLVPRGKLHTVKTRRGDFKRTRVENGAHPLGRTSLRKAWRRFETVAGVSHLDWRNWYGMRRISSDLAEDVEQDGRVLNQIGGWTDEATRRKYQEEGRADVAERVRKVRQRIRPDRSKPRTDNGLKGAT